ncbi:hypothetical protein PPTG_23579 [Phytophthora nicotianae INRA-310]|uniref:Uncharacterized protein n=1 Tax=Phytophthora nicotianae (strain INRA-310) TaxID=761204 RepID=W2PVN9_PHYN3|nr:hypothetical protein PPTG_23579 [Phytophthora nicotianae INRA-310]ETN04706.1 hypothetical protein PPTG_23579 [Phytophthora nicotianae INRA-310]
MSYKITRASTGEGALRTIKTAEGRILGDNDQRSFVRFNVGLPAKRDKLIHILGFGHRDLVLLLRQIVFHCSFMVPLQGDNVTYLDALNLVMIASDRR